MVRYLGRIAISLAVGGIFAAPAAAQLLPLGGGGPGGGLGGGLVPGVVNTIPHTLRRATEPLNGTLNHTMKSTMAVVRDAVGRPIGALQSDAIEKDVNGAPVVRGDVLCLAPSDQTLTTARKLDFAIARREDLPGLGFSVVVLRAPDGMSVTDALKTLRAADPSGRYDYDHIYDPSGGTFAARGQGATPAPVSGVARIGMIDAGIDRMHPALRGAALEIKTFAGGGEAPPTMHGTAVASLLVGDDGDFHGALTGATLYAADVYGGAADGGSADDIARALSWLAAHNVPVANISLVGPPNLILAAATAAFVARGHVLVAAVGNGGPAAPARFPADYPGVVGVTSVDGHLAIQIDANRGHDVAFAARGVGVRVATLPGGYTDATGTSFAAPIVAARFGLLMPRADSADVARAWIALEKTAVDLGAPGRDPVFGYGYLSRPGTALVSSREQARVH